MVLKVCSRFKLIGRIHVSAFNHNAKELPLTLKYTIYSTLQIKGFTLSQEKKKKKKRRRVVKSCRSIFCLPLQQKGRKRPSFQPLKPEELVFKRAIDREITDGCSFSQSNGTIRILSSFFFSFVFFHFSPFIIFIHRRDLF